MDGQTDRLIECNDYENECKAIRRGLFLRLCLDIAGFSGVGRERRNVVSSLRTSCA